MPGSCAMPGAACRHAASITMPVTRGSMDARPLGAARRSRGAAGRDQRLYDVGTVAIVHAVRGAQRLYPHGAAHRAGVTVLGAERREVGRGPEAAAEEERLLD